MLVPGIFRNDSRAFAKRSIWRLDSLDESLWKLSVAELVDSCDLLGRSASDQERFPKDDGGFGREFLAGVQSVAGG